MKKEPSFSIFKNATAKKHLSIITLSEAIDGIRNGEWREQVGATREVLDSQSNDYYKRHRARTLPLFALSGEMPSKAAGETLTSHSGLLQGDFDGKDHPGITPAQMRNMAISSPHVVAVFVSPSGKGVKAIIRILASVESHRACFESAKRHFAELGLKIDPTTKDQKRLCYVSHDPEMLSRALEETKILEPSEIETPELRTSAVRRSEDPLKNHSSNANNSQQREDLQPSKYQRSSSDCTVDTSDDIEPQITKSIQKKGKREEKGRKLPLIAEREASAKRAQAKLAKNKRLSKLYKVYIEKTHTPRQGERNTRLIKMVTFLFRAVSEASALPLVMAYYDINQDVFKDTREQHEHEAKSHLDNTKREWIQNLNEIERGWFIQFSEEKKRHRENSFVVCLELARESIRKGGNGIFFLAGEQLAWRIAHNETEAARILNQFITWGLLERVKKGNPRSKGKARLASSYRWLLRHSE